MRPRFDGRTGRVVTERAEPAGRPTVLLAMPHGRERAAVEAALARAGAVVTLAPSARAGARLSARGRFALAVVGDEAALGPRDMDAALRQASDGGRTPVVAVGGAADKARDGRSNVRARFAAGAADLPARVAGVLRDVTG